MLLTFETVTKSVGLWKSVITIPQTLEISQFPSMFEKYELFLSGFTENPLS